MGISAVDYGKVIAKNPAADVITEGSQAVPIAGNFLSGIATWNDIWGNDGMVNDYSDCMAGGN